MSKTNNMDTLQNLEQPPYSCLMNFIENDMTCGTRLTKEQEQEAFNVFKNITGYEPINNNLIYKQLGQYSLDMARYNAGYCFGTIFLVSIIILWLLVFVGKINVPLGFFITMLLFIIIYGVSVAYRQHIYNVYFPRFNNAAKKAEQSQNTFNNGVAYWIQAMLAIACKLTCNDSNCWGCNLENCLQCNRGNTPQKQQKDNSNMKLEEQYRLFQEFLKNRKI